MFIRRFVFDGDGKTDIAVWRPSTGIWYRINSSDNQVFIYQFGVNGDKQFLPIICRNYYPFHFIKSSTKCILDKYFVDDFLYKL